MESANAKLVPIKPSTPGWQECLGILLEQLICDHAHWSQITFGLDTKRGPLGALKHLEKEAREAQDKPQDIMEYADCLLILLDASRRAGISIFQLLSAATTKMYINRQRTWPKPAPNDMPTEHIRDAT